MKGLRDGLAAKVAGTKRTLSFVFGVAVLAMASGWEVSRGVDSSAGLAAPGSGEPSGGRKAVVEPSFDLGAVMEQVHYAFREREGAWRGGHTTYEVALRDGVLEVKPWHHPNGRRPGAAPPAPKPWDRALLSRREPPRREEVVEGSVTRFGPARVERGGTLLAESQGTSAAGERGQLEVARGSMTEQLRNGPAGVEQSWRFAELPEGRGDLEVRVRLAAGELVGETEGGLHFSSGALGVRYGHGTWIDGLGNDTRVPVRWDGGAVVLTVPARVLEGSIYPATLDPIISPELGMDEPVYGPAMGVRYSPKVASDGNGYLAVWEDLRTGTGTIQVYGARVSASGSVLDAAGIPISTAAEIQQSPAVAWGGSSYLVVWEEIRSGVDVYGARVSASGSVLDAAGIPISTASEEQGAPGVASDGSNFLVVWVDGRSGPAVHVYGARVSASGSVLDAAGIPISTAANSQTSPEVAWGGSSYLVVWEDFRRGGSADIYGARVSASGNVIDADGILISTASYPQWEPAVAWNGSTYLVVWSDFETDYDIHAARVSASGTVLDAEGIPISTAADAQYSPAVAWDGSSYLVAWEDDRSGYGDIYAARVSASGTVIDAAGIPISTAAEGQYYPALAWSGSNTLVVWGDLRNEASPDIYGARVSASGSVLDAEGIAIATAANAQDTPAVAWGGSDYLVVWADYRNGESSGRDIYGARVSTSGSVLDAAGIAIATAANAQDTPAVAWGGNDYLVVWADSRNGESSGLDIYGARVSASGSVLDAEGIPISTASNDQYAPAVAWDGSNTLVVWGDGRNETSTGSDIYGARVSASGSVLDAAGIPISTASARQYSPAVAWDGSNTLVVWDDWRNETSTESDIYGARVSASGSVLDAEGIPISTAANPQYSPAVAWDGSNFLVVWVDGRNGPDVHVYGARVSASGGVLDAAGIPISTAASSQTSPAVAWDGSSTLVVWQDLSSRPYSDSDIYGARVSAGGSVLDGDGFLVSGSAYDEARPRVASPGPRRFLVLYQGFDARQDVGATRVLGRDVLFDTPPEAVAQTVTTDEDVPIALTLTGTDADGDVLTYVVRDGPFHGALGVTEGNEAGFRYEPADDYNGADAFTFVANDGWVDSAPATVSIAVRPVNDAPVALAQAVTTDENVPVAIALGAQDVEGDALTYAVVTPPSHGGLGGTGPNLTYAPATGYSGPDAFTFKVNDGILDSSPATVSIEVALAGEPGKDGCGCTTGVDPSSPGLLLIGMLVLRRRWRGARRPGAG